MAEMTMVERVAARLANNRAVRNGAPAVMNVLEFIKPLAGGKLYDEVMEDARAALEAMREPSIKMHDAAVLIFVRENGGIEHAPVIAWRAMIDAALAEGPTHVAA